MTTDGPDEILTVFGALVELIAHDPAARDRLAAALAAPPRTLYTVASLAVELGKSDRTIRRAIESGELPATRRCGQLVIVAEDVAAWARTGPAAARRTRPTVIGTKRRTATGGLRAVVDEIEDAAA